MIYYIYELVDPRDGRVFYVGMTNDTRRRMADHMRPSDDAKGQVIQAIIADGQRPQMNVLENTEDREEAKEREKHWQDYYLQVQGGLTNDQKSFALKDVIPRLNSTYSQHPLTEALTDYIGTTEAAKLLGVTDGRIRQIVQINIAGEYLLPSITFGRRRYILKAHFAEYAAYHQSAMCQDITRS